jgi:cell division protein FtsB
MSPEILAVGSRVVPVILIAAAGAVPRAAVAGPGQHVRTFRALQQKLDAQKAANLLARQANERLAAEVRDLQEGLEMVEEKARLELGMVKPNEIYVQVGPLGARLRPARRRDRTRFGPRPGSPSFWPPPSIPVPAFA